MLGEAGTEGLYCGTALRSVAPARARAGGGSVGRGRNATPGVEETGIREGARCARLAIQTANRALSRAEVRECVQSRIMALNAYMAAKYLKRRNLPVTRPEGSGGVRSPPHARTSHLGRSGHELRHRFGLSDPQKERGTRGLLHFCNTQRCSTEFLHVNCCKRKTLMAYTPAARIGRATSRSWRAWSHLLRPCR